MHTRRIAKVVKGGRRLRFNALVVVGNGQGQVGAGMGKALAIPDAVRKGTAVARRSTINIPIKGSTIPTRFPCARARPSSSSSRPPLGTGIIAAGAMRAMLELGGVQDVVGKSLGSRNPINIVQATLEALSLLRDPEVERANRLGLNQPATNGAAESTEPSGRGAQPAAAPAPSPAPAPAPAAEAAATAPPEATAAETTAPAPAAAATAETAPPEATAAEIPAPEPAEAETTAPEPVAEAETAAPEAAAAEVATPDVAVDAEPAAAATDADETAPAADAAAPEPDAEPEPAVDAEANTVAEADETAPSGE